MYAKPLTAFVFSVFSLACLLLSPSLTQAANCFQVSQWAFESIDHEVVIEAPHSVALGDIDDDGFPDFAYSYSPAYQGSPFGGVVYVISGKSKTALYTLTTPNQVNEYYKSFGWSIAPAGDVNGDGRPDIMIGEPAFSVTSENPIKGFVFVFDALSGDLLFSIEEPEAHSDFGFALAGLGDLNSDGYDDILVGAPSRLSSGVGFFWHGAGRAYVLSGQTVSSGDVSGSILYTYDGVSAYAALGSEVVNLGDLNNDGVNDFAIGQGVRATYDMGPVQVVSGSDGALLYSIAIENQLFHNISSSVYRYDDISIAPVGDFDSDGISDFLIGNPRDTTNGRNSGAAYLHSGADGVLLDTYYSPMPADSTGFGKSVAGSSDVNGDGVPDILIGSYYARPGLGGYDRLEVASVHLFSGADKSLLYSIAPNNEANGQFVAMLGGDVTGDCLGEVLIGSDGQVNLTSFPDGCGSLAAASCAGCCNLPGDVNGDGSSNIADLTYLIRRIFAGGPAPVCCQEADVNSDGRIAIDDATTIIATIFLGGAVPSCGPVGILCGASQE